MTDTTGTDPSASLRTGRSAAVDGRSARWDDHREARREELVHVARRLVHHRGPDVSMDEIAAAAGTSKSIVYRYFTDKSGLQLAVAEAVVHDIRDALAQAADAAPTPREALRGMVATYLAMIESSPNVYAFVTRDASAASGGEVGHFLDSVTRLVGEPFARVASVTAPDHADAASAQESAWLWAAGAVGFVRGAGERWLAQRGTPGAPDLDTVTAQVAAWLWAGSVGLVPRDRPGAPPAQSAQPAPAADATAASPAGVDDDARTSREEA